GTEPPAGPRVSALSLAGSLACYALAFAAEPTAIVLPVILFWADWVRGGWPRLRACGAVHGLYGLFFIALMLVRVASGGDGGTEYLRAPGAVFGALTVYLERLLPHVFWPVALNPIAPSVAGMAISSLGLGILACLMVAAVLLIAVRGIGGVALLWPLAAACAAVCLLPSDDLLTARRAYFAMAGFALLAPWLFSVVTPRLARTALGLIVAGCVLASGVLTYQRLVLWSEPVRLWPPAADAVPDDARPWEYLGTLAVESARSAANAPEARAHWMAADRCWREALHRKPGDVSYRGKLGMTLRQLGRDAEAMTELRDVLRRNPFDQAAALQIALLHEARTRGAVLAAFDEARARAGWSPQIGEEFVRLLRAHPDGPDVAAHFALLFEAWGRTGHDIEPLRLAAQYFARARALGELPVEALARYAAVLAGIGDVVSCAGVLSEAARGAPEGALKAVAERFARLAGQAAAIEARAQALLVTPDRIIEGMRVMGEAALLRGEWTQAGYLLETAIEKEPANETTWLSLGYLRACTGAADAFVRDHGGDAVATPEAWSKLATRCMAGGSWETAESYLGHNADLGDEVRRSLALGKIALEVGRAERAAHYFDKAVNVRPDDSAPWLELCDIAIEHGDGAGAARYLGEAERRGAASEDVAARREKIKERGGPTAPETTPRTIIR
ncbi:MAG TPA: hypothetical protein PKI11_05530, partial [Candidatus Hydrogenedentes bacterium]|nr:hypothetical protein [Candidatus Hydrogenedentota bacterium]